MKLFLLLPLVAAFPYQNAPHSGVILAENLSEPAELYGFQRTLIGTLVASANLCSNSSDDSKYFGKIVLLGRDICSLVSRAERLQKSGSIAVVIKDFPWPQGTLLDSINADWNVPIPAAFVSENSFSALERACPLNIRISLADDLFIYDVLACLLFLLTFICISIIMLRPCVHRSVASDSAIAALPTHPWAPGKPPQPFPRERSTTISSQTYHTQSHRLVLSECVICLQNFVDGDIVLSLPCDHDFHRVCMYIPFFSSLI